jgi:hypothetical protein
VRPIARPHAPNGRSPAALDDALPSSPPGPLP